MTISPPPTESYYYKYSKSTFRKRCLVLITVGVLLFLKSLITNTRLKLKNDRAVKQNTPCISYCSNQNSLPSNAEFPEANLINFSKYFTALGTERPLGHFGMAMTQIWPSLEPSIVIVSVTNTRRVIAGRVGKLTIFNCIL